MKSNIKLPSLNRRSFLKKTGAAAVGLTVMGNLPDALLAAEDKKLSFYNWDTYTGENNLSNFKKLTGIEVKQDLFASNEELFTKLSKGNPGYDLIVPTGDFVAKMAGANMLIPLDYSKIPNTKNLIPRFKDAPFDPKRKYSITYLWGTIGIGYNSKRVKGVPDTWKVFYDSPQYAGRIVLFGSTSELYRLGLMYLGYNANETDPKKIKEVEKLLIQQKKYIKAFHSDNGQDLLLSGECDLVQEFNGDIAQVNAEDAALKYTVPKEGGLIWQDTIAIPKGAPHPQNAHAYINYILGVDAGLDLAETVQFATPNQAVLDKASAEYKNNPFIFPSKAVLDKCQEAVYLGIAYDQMVEESFTRVRAA